MVKSSLSRLVVPFLALGFAAACAAEKASPDEIIVTPGAGAAERSDPVTPPIANAAGGDCEELGALAASSLVATLDTSGAAPVESTTITLAGRPVLTKVRIFAAGEPSALIGGTAVLGAAANVSFSTCSHCLVIAVGCTADCSSATLFYPRSGTATFTALASAPGESFAGTFRDVELEQVTIDRDTLATSPVPGGACIRIPSMTFSGKTEVGTSSGDPGGGGSGGGSSGGTSGDLDGGTDGGSKSGGGGGGGGGDTTKNI